MHPTHPNPKHATNPPSPLLITRKPRIPTLIIMLGHIRLRLRQLTNRQLRKPRRLHPILKRNISTQTRTIRRCRIPILHAVEFVPFPGADDEVVERETRPQRVLHLVPGAAGEGVELQVRDDAAARVVPCGGDDVEGEAVVADVGLGCGVVVHDAVDVALGR